MDETTMKLGLLMEAAHAQQAAATSSMDTLGERIRDLDAVVRDEIRRVLMDELRQLHSETILAEQSLRSLRRSAARRFVLTGAALVTLVMVLAAGAVWAMFPGRAEMAALRLKRDAMLENIARLEKAGGGLQWRRCGARLQLCVRVEDREPAYGEHSDFRIVKGD